jgi:mono/diheme cytochrome c family protein
MLTRSHGFLTAGIAIAGLIALGFASCTQQTIKIRDTEGAAQRTGEPLPAGGSACTTLVRDFELQIVKPILSPHCAECHKPGEKSFGLTSGDSPRFVDLVADLNTIAGFAQQGSESAEDSLLVAKATGRVPHEGGKVLSRTSLKLLALQNFEKKLAANSDCAEKNDSIEKKVLQCMTNDLKPVFAAASQAAFENCVRCHGTGRGRLKFDAEVSQFNETQMITGFSRFFASDTETAPALLLEKPIGDGDHGGGPIVLESSEEYAKIKALGIAVQSNNELKACLKAAFP